MVRPIWKDYFVELGSDDSYKYRIVIHETREVIYSGTAHRRPEDDECFIKINEICADYLKNELPAMTRSEFGEYPLILTFDVMIPSGQYWETIESIPFYNDWSYDNGYDPQVMGMSFPVNGEIDARQWLFLSALMSPGMIAEIHHKDGTIETKSFMSGNPGSYNDDFSDAWSKMVANIKTGVISFNIGDYDDVDYISIGNNIYRVVSSCAKYALYYVNAYGGWDTLLIQGNATEADDLKRYTREMEYDNRFVSNRGKQNYVNEITKTYTLNTGWLTDSQASRMHHLLNSTEVYLYDLATGDMIPVVLPATTTEYKTRLSAERVINYTIQAEVAHNLIRR